MNATQKSTIRSIKTTGETPLLYRVKTVGFFRNNVHRDLILYLVGYFYAYEFKLIGHIQAGFKCSYIACGAQEAHRLVAIGLDAKNPRLTEESGTVGDFKFKKFLFF